MRGCTQACTLTARKWFLYRGEKDRAVLIQADKYCVVVLNALSYKTKKKKEEEKKHTYWDFIYYSPSASVGCRLGATWLSKHAKDARSLVGCHATSRPHLKRRKNPSFEKWKIDCFRLKISNECTRFPQWVPGSAHMSSFRWLNSIPLSGGNYIGGA